MGGIVDSLIEKIENFVGRFLFMLEKLVCLVISWMQDLFEVFTGIKKAKLGNDDEYLINIFFGNRVINGVYLGMAAIGFILAFVFAAMAVAKKAADIDDKMRMSHSQILRSLIKSIIIIASMTLIMMLTMSMTTGLMDGVNAAFDNAPSMTGVEPHKVFTDEQFAAMSRVFNTVGNYSLNPSFNNRYNLNSCYNEIRPYLQYLGETGVFDYNYNDEVNGRKINTWQSVLQELAVAADYTKEQPVDTYNEGIANALNNCMDILKNDYSFKALESYDKTDQYNPDETKLDRVLFLMGTMGIGNNAAARNEAFNKSPDIEDNIRGPYYTGDKSLYDTDQVNKDFYISFTRMNYYTVYFAGVTLIVNLAVILVNCVVRIFNLLFLYIIAPPVIATMPFDDGGKFKQWITAFIVQAFSVFATLISMRLFLIFVPIVMNPDLKLVSNSLLNMIGKLIMIWAGTIAVEKANGLLTGILADSAGWQSITAGSVAQDVKGSTIGRMARSAESAVGNAITSPVKSVASTAWSVTKGAAGAAASIATLPVRPLVGAVSHAGKNVANAYHSFMDSASDSIISDPNRKSAKQQANAETGEKLQQRQFRDSVTGYINRQNNGNDRQNNNNLPNNNNNNDPPPNNNGQNQNNNDQNNNNNNDPNRNNNGQNNDQNNDQYNNNNRQNVQPPPNRANNNGRVSDQQFRNVFGIDRNEANERQRRNNNNRQQPPGRNDNNNINNNDN